MKVKKLDNGKYRVRVYDYQDSAGKIHTKTFTGWSKRECMDMANEYLESKKPIASNYDKMLFKDACEMYINGRTNILSPSTIKKYKYMQKNFEMLDNIPLGRIDSPLAQKYINSISKELSAKSVRDRYGLLRSILASYTHSNDLKVVLPRKEKTSRYLPDSDDIVKILDSCQDEQLKLAICLGAYGMMRAGEICAFTKDDLSDDNTLHIHRNMVITPENDYVIKSPKTLESDRLMPLPEFVAEMIRNMPEDSIGLNPNNITKKFERHLKSLDIPHFRFHDLRHYACSIYHDKGCSDATLKKLGGWSSDSGNRTMQEIYRHAFESSIARQTADVVKYFEDLNKKEG